MTDETSNAGLDRRSFLALGAAATGAAVILPATPAFAARQARAAGDAFTLGVASGDPLPDSVILWTRLAPSPLDLDGGMGDTVASVEWEVARDEGFGSIVASGTVEATATYGHSVHVDVKGLAPDSWYYFRFRYGSEISPVGRTRTTPEFGAGMSRLVVGQVSCANWQSGYYQLYGDLADQQPDYWVHLGDYIYEYGDDGYLRSTQNGVPTRSIPWDSEPFTVGEYRRQYGLYRSDPDLQRLHATAPYSVIWDDHEVDNNFTAAKSGGDGQKDIGEFLTRRAAAFQAFWENHAIRIPQPEPMPSSMTIYRTVNWGTLASFFLLDGRQYRSDQPGRNTPNDFGGLRKGMFSRKATMLGAEQEQWLRDGLAADQARWSFISQQTVMSHLNGAAAFPDPSFIASIKDGLFNYDAWDGYWRARGRLVRSIVNGGVRNPMILTGDFHTNLVFELLDRWPNPSLAKTPAEMSAAVRGWEGTKIGAEICAGAISSPTFFGDSTLGLDSIAPLVKANTPWIAYADFKNNGYVLHDITADSDRAQFRVCLAQDKPGTEGGTPKADSTVVINDGVPGVSDIIPIIPG